jgi:hypothetical protein
MLRGPITASDFKGQFSGHETFPLRHLWLRKAFDAVEAGAPRTIFSSPESIVTFGVGKNMALAIRHWALACGVIEERDTRVGTTELGRNLFGGERPWDPFMEKPATAWLVQWQIAGDPKTTTTWYWAFNHWSRKPSIMKRSARRFCNMLGRGNGLVSLRRQSRATSNVSSEVTYPALTKSPVKTPWNRSWQSSDWSVRSRAVATSSDVVPSRASPMASSPTR